MKTTRPHRPMSRGQQIAAATIIAVHLLLIVAPLVYLAIGY